jgi:hypothetical protein
MCYWVWAGMIVTVMATVTCIFEGHVLVGSLFQITPEALPRAIALLSSISFLDLFWKFVFNQCESMFRTSFAFSTGIWHIENTLNVTKLFYSECNLTKSTQNIACVNDKINAFGAPGCYHIQTWALVILMVMYFYPVILIVINLAFQISRSWISILSTSINVILALARVVVSIYPALAFGIFRQCNNTFSQTIVTTFWMSICVTVALVFSAYKIELPVARSAQTNQERDNALTQTLFGTMFFCWSLAIIYDKYMHFVRFMVDFFTPLVQNGYTNLDEVDQMNAINSLSQGYPFFTPIKSNTCVQGYPLHDCASIWLNFAKPLEVTRVLLTLITVLVLLGICFRTELVSQFGVGQFIDSINTIAGMFFPSKSRKNNTANAGNAQNQVAGQANIPVNTLVIAQGPGQVPPQNQGQVPPQNQGQAPALGLLPNLPDNTYSSHSSESGEDLESDDGWGFNDDWESDDSEQWPN